MKSISLNDNDLIIGSRVRECRIKWSLTQQELADELDISPNYVGEIECGRRSLSLPLAEQLCAHFGITYDYLYLGMEHPVCHLFKDENSDKKQTTGSSKDLLLSFVASSSEEDCQDYLTLLSGIRQILERKRSGSAEE